MSTGLPGIETPTVPARLIRVREFVDVPIVVFVEVTDGEPAVELAGDTLIFMVGDVGH